MLMCYDEYGKRMKLAANAVNLREDRKERMKLTANAKRICREDRKAQDRASKIFVAREENNMKKTGWKIAAALVMSALLLTGCGSTNSEGETITGGENGAESVDGVATLSASPTEDEIIEYLKWIIPKSDEVYTKLTLRWVDRDESDTIVGGSGFDYQRVTDPQLQSIADLDAFVSSVFWEGAAYKYYLAYVYEGFEDLTFIEEDGKLYIHPDTYTNEGNWEWQLDEGVEFVYITNSRIALYADAVAPFDDSEICRGKIILVREDGVWKLDTIDPYGIFDQLDYAYEGQEGIVDTWEEVMALLEENEDLLLGRSLSEFIVDLDINLRYMKNENWITESWIGVNVYELIDGELSLVSKLFVSPENGELLQEIPEREGVVMLYDYFVAAGYDFAEGLFGYVMIEAEEDELPEDILGNFSETMLSSDNMQYANLWYDSTKVLFIVPKYYGTSIEVRDSSGRLRIYLEDEAVAIGNTGLSDDSVVTIRNEIFGSVSFSLSEATEALAEAGGFLLDYEYPKAVG